MTFWQENYSFIKDVYDKRIEKLEASMNETQTAMNAVKADTLYTSEDFKRIKETFMNLARGMENQETRKWLYETKDTLMTDKGGPEKEKEQEKLNTVLARYDAMLPELTETKSLVDCLWKSYQYTDELCPVIEFLEDMKFRSTKEINSNSAAQTEELIEKQEKIFDNLGKKRKLVGEQQTKGEKILADSKAPNFLRNQVNSLKSLWKESNSLAEQRLKSLRGNLSAWERYEQEKGTLEDKFEEAKRHLNCMKRIYNIIEAPKEHETYKKTSNSLRKQIESDIVTFDKTHAIVDQLLGEEKKTELLAQKDALHCQLEILEQINARLSYLAEFDIQLVAFVDLLKERENWLEIGRNQMNNLLNPGQSMTAEERVMQTMELTAEVRTQIEKMSTLLDTWNEKLTPDLGQDENSNDAQLLSNRIESVKSTQNNLLKEVLTEGAKYGDDVKYLADFTNAFKKFDTWMAKSEAKKNTGLIKPKSLEEAQTKLDDIMNWKSESESMRTIIDDAMVTAKKMTLHEDADAKYEDGAKKLAVIDKLADEWINKLTKMVAVWKKQTETAAMVTAAISTKPSEGQTEMKLEDLEKHLDALKQMFIDKKKMMEELGKEA